jgi:hypothetical protein
MKKINVWSVIKVNTEYYSVFENEKNALDFMEEYF